MARGSRTTRSVGTMTSIRGRIFGGRRDRDAERHEAHLAEAALMEQAGQAEGAVLDAIGRARQKLLAGANSEELRAAWDEFPRLLVDCSKAMRGHPEDVLPNEASVALAVHYTDVAEILTSAGPLARGALPGSGITNGRITLTPKERAPYLDALDRATRALATIARGRDMITRLAADERAKRR